MDNDTMELARRVLEAAGESGEVCEVSVTVRPERPYAKTHTRTVRVRPGAAPVVTEGMSLDEYIELHMPGARA